MTKNRLSLLKFISLFLILASYSSFGQISIFTTQVPADEGGGGPFELGTKFTVSTVAKITAIRFYKSENDTVPHVGHIWTNSGAHLTSVNFAGETADGWQTATLAEPLVVYPEKVYIVSVNSAVNFARTLWGLEYEITHEFLSTVADYDNGRFNYTAGNFPNEHFNASNNFRDVVAEEAPVPQIGLSWPVGGTQIYSNSQTFLWYLNFPWGEALTYELHLSDDPTMAVYDTYNAGDQLQYTINNLEDGKTYYWRVRAKDSHGNVLTTTGTESFKTPAIAGIPEAVPSWPIGDNTVYTTDQRLSWYMNGPSAGLKYKLKYADNPGWNNAVVVDNITETGYNLTGLDLGASYYWKVKAFDDNSESDWSEVASFVVWSGSWVVVPRPGSPAQGVYISSSAPTLTWFLPTAGNAVTGYEVQWSNNPNFTNATSQQITSTNFALGNLNAYNTVYWRVRSKNDNGDYSDYSATASFVPTSPNSISEPEVPTTFELSQNYPNPFNPSTVISFSVPKEAFVTLKVYDITGTLVKTLVSENKVIGFYNVTFDASSLVSGVYFYRLEAGDVAISKKMMLLK
ncbi:MAG: DUF4082 domain-containing protein [Ignavibacteria bacterium]|nr:DUF4082 domain-containing protein [Ignavibacteria bacterium]